MDLIFIVSKQNSNWKVLNPNRFNVSLLVNHHFLVIIFPAPVTKNCMV